MQTTSPPIAARPVPVSTAVTVPVSSYLRWAMTSIVLGGYISVLTNHIMNMVIPKMMSDLGTDVVTIRWVVTAYMIANATAMPLAGWLTRTLGARQLYICCLLVFVSGTAFCGAATSMPMLIVFRIFQGLGGGLIMPVTMMLMLDLYPAERRGLGTSIWSMGASCGSLTGIPLGGIVAEHLSWRAAFYLTMPPGILALLIAMFIMKPSPRERSVPFDWWGFLTLSAAMITLLLALSNGQREGWDSTPIVLLFSFFAVSMATFLWIEPRMQTPLVDLRLFLSRQYALGIGLCLVAGAMFNGGPFLLSLFLQNLYDFSVQDAAMIMFPSSAFLVFFTPLAGWASDRMDARYLMILGYILYGIFGLAMAFADLRLSAMMLLIIYFGRGLGLGLSYSIIYPIAISGLEAVKGKAATTLLNLCITLGGALTVSILAAILEQRQQIRAAWLAETQQLTEVGTQQGLRMMETLATQFGGSLPSAAHAKVLLSQFIQQQASILAFNDTFGTFVVISLCGIVLALFFRRAQSLR